MFAPTDKTAEQKRIVAFLAKACCLPVVDMATIYEAERAALAVGAHVTDFLHIFAIRHVLERLGHHVARVTHQGLDPEVGR